MSFDMLSFWEKKGTKCMHTTVNVFLLKSLLGDTVENNLSLGAQKAVRTLRILFRIIVSSCVRNHRNILLKTILSIVSYKLLMAFIVYISEIPCS
jgi:hypothetical protein